MLEPSPQRVSPVDHRIASTVLVSVKYATKLDLKTKVKSKDRNEEMSIKLD